jgi:hypothetical protein
LLVLVVDYTDAVGGSAQGVPLAVYSLQLRGDCFEGHAAGFCFLDDLAALSHFVRYGMSEGRQATASFNVTYYINRYGDLRNAFGNNLQRYYMHYIQHGIQEGRIGTNTNTP